MKTKIETLQKKINEISEMTPSIWVLFEGMHEKKKSNITFHQYLTLEKIKLCPNCTINQISKKMNIAQSTASQLIDRLVQAKLVTRTENPNNRRETLINLSQEGELTLKKQKKNIEKGYYELLKMLTPDEQEKLLTSFRILYEVSKCIENKIHGDKK